MRKILFVISQLHKAGAESSLVNLLHKLDKTKYDIDFIVMNQVPVAGATSLIGDVPKDVHLFNVYEEDHSSKNGIRRLCLNHLQGDKYYESAINFVSGKNYDLAVHVGEWWTPEFIIHCVQAKRKVAWFHADIDKQASFSADVFFSYDEVFDAYLFVSKHSMESACKRFDFIKEKSFLLHNCIDRDSILSLSNEPTDYRHDGKKPLLITVANIRTEKNHLRALEAMKILNDKGYDFTWWNVGHKSVSEIAAQLEQNAKAYGIGEDFLLLGAHKNPYPLLRQADALACLSDHESWSLVITEARCLGVPIVATKTSGATEQVIDGKNGTLTDFNAQSIADGIERVLLDRQVNALCKEYLKTMDAIPDPIDELEELFDLPDRQEKQKSILYVIDDVNYKGGAHHAAFQHIRVLQKNGMSVAVYSGTLAGERVRSLLPGVSFFSYAATRDEMLFERRLAGCLLAKDVTLREKQMRLESFVYFRKHRDMNYRTQREMDYIKELAAGYNVVCLLSEGSKYKKTVADSSARKKIQWIHTDYCTWSNLTEYARNLTKDDAEIWKKMDHIVVLSKAFIEPLAARYPHLKEKITAIGNIQPVNQIIEKSEKQVWKHMNVVCVLDKENAEKCGAQILGKLFKWRNYKRSFYWIIVGMPFDALKKYPVLNDSVTCVPELASIDANGLLREKDLLIIPESRTELIAAAHKKKIPTAVISKTANLKQPIGNGWILSENDDVCAFVAENMFAVNNMCNIASYTDKENSFSDSRKQPVHFVSCFRFEPVKNVGGMIRALGRLHISGVPFKWTFIGDGEEMPLARDLVTAYGMESKVTFTGSMSNPYPIMKQADVFVQFSRYEGLPNTIYEALILGIPVLSTKVGAIPDQIDHNKTGWLIEPKEEALSAAVVDLIENPEKIKIVKEQLQDYRYDNSVVERELLNVFGC